MLKGGRYGRLLLYKGMGVENGRSRARGGAFSLFERIGDVALDSRRANGLTRAPDRERAETLSDEPHIYESGIVHLLAASRGRSPGLLGTLRLGAISVGASLLVT